MEDSFDDDHYLTWPPQLDFFSHGLTTNFHADIT